MRRFFVEHEIGNWVLIAAHEFEAVSVIFQQIIDDLSRFFGVSERGFERAFAGSAFLRARRKGMARNALTVLGNTRAPQGWELLLAGAADPAWEVREAAAWALRRWDESGHLKALQADPHEAVRTTAGGL